MITELYSRSNFTLFNRLPLESAELASFSSKTAVLFQFETKKQNTVSRQLVQPFLATVPVKEDIKLGFYLYKAKPCAPYHKLVGTNPMWMVTAAFGAEFNTIQDMYSDCADWRALPYKSLPLLLDGIAPPASSNDKVSQYFTSSLLRQLWRFIFHDLAAQSLMPKLLDIQELRKDLEKVFDIPSVLGIGYPKTYKISGSSVWTYHQRNFNRRTYMQYINAEQEVHTIVPPELIAETVLTTETELQEFNQMRNQSHVTNRDQECLNEIQYMQYTEIRLPKGTQVVLPVMQRPKGKDGKNEELLKAELFESNNKKWITVFMESFVLRHDVQIILPDKKKVTVYVDPSKEGGLTPNPYFYKSISGQHTISVEHGTVPLGKFPVVEVI